MYGSSVEGQVAGQQTHTAVDIADTARGDHAMRQGRGRYAADRKAVALMDVGHGDGVAGDTRQRGGVDQLFYAAVGQRLFDQGTAGIDARGHAHVTPERLRDLPDIIVDLF
jgi:hypothetical protein